MGCSACRLQRRQHVGHRHIDCGGNDMTRGTKIEPLYAICTELPQNRRD